MIKSASVHARGMGTGKGNYHEAKHKVGVRLALRLCSPLGIESSRTLCR